MENKSFRKQVFQQRPHQTEKLSIQYFANSVAINMITGLKKVLCIIFSHFNVVFSIWAYWNFSFQDVDSYYQIQFAIIFTRLSMFSSYWTSYNTLYAKLNHVTCKSFCCHWGLVLSWKLNGCAKMFGNKVSNARITGFHNVHLSSHLLLFSLSRKFLLSFK